MPFGRLPPIWCKMCLISCRIYNTIKIGQGTGRISGRSKNLKRKAVRMVSYGGGRKMKREWILWNVLCSSERGAGNERIEQIEKNGYCWSYRIFILVICILGFLLWIFPAFAVADGSDGMVPADSLWFMALLGISITEMARFLYSCFHGEQESFERTGGLWCFASQGILAGIWALAGAYGFWSLQDYRTWIAFALGAIVFWLLCHLAYLHYAMSTEEGKEKRAKTFGIAVVVICVLALAGYGVFAITGITHENTGNLTEEEKGYADAIEWGREGYEKLESVKMECFYRDADAEENAVFQNGGIAHSFYWITPDMLYTMVLEPGTDEVYQEFFRDSEMEWHIAEGKSWISERDYQANGEMPYENTQPYTGILPLQLEAIESITKERRDGQTVYTVEYGPDYETALERIDAVEVSGIVGAMEEYTLNEYGVMTGYVLEEYELTGEGEKRCAEWRAFTVLSVDAEQNEAEVRELVGQYEQG